MDRALTEREKLRSSAEIPASKPAASYQPPRIVLFGKTAKIVQGEPNATHRDNGPDKYWG
jgi:hypothetical protein